MNVEATHRLNADIANRERISSMRFALEPYSEKLIQEMRPLWDEHDAEVPQMLMRLDPDLSLYSACEKNGTLRIFTARIGSLLANVLVGYQVFFVMQHPHRKYSQEANQDILWLDPEVRKGMVGVKFMKWADQKLMNEGVKVIHRQISARNDFGNILRRMDYDLMDSTYARRI